MKLRGILLAFLAIQLCSIPLNADVLQSWRGEWPRTDFSRTTVPLEEIQRGGPGKDGIPAIDEPRFVQVADYREVDPMDPVIGVVIGKEARAYPLRVLIWHEIVNDVIAGIPVAVTYCPLCNTAIVFDRRLDGELLDFGTTGNLRYSDLVMYDRQTESWWQQFGGDAIVGELAGKALRRIPSRLESIANFRERAPDGRVLVPADPNLRDYGASPFAGYDRTALPLFYMGEMPEGVHPMMRVVAVGDVAFTLPLLVRDGMLEHDGMVIAWSAGQRSAVDSDRVEWGRDVGNVVVTRAGRDVDHVVTFAFAFHAFHPEGIIHTESGAVRP